MRNWYDIIQPHADIRKGNFDEAVFAADIGDVADGKAPPDYNDPYLFYKKTYLTAGLKGLLHKAHDKLVHGTGASVIQIKTPFGGGKTHALVALYHYLQHGAQIKELLPPGLALLQSHLSVINGEHFNPLEGRTSDGVTRYTLWGEIAYQIGGRSGYEQFRANDEARISPGKADLRDFLAAHQPFILLFDEILEYVNRALDVKVKDETGVSLGTQTFSFFQELSDAVATLDNGLLVVTLPVSRLEDFGDKEEVSLARMGKIFGRVESIETPVEGQEVYAVIRRRLFEVETLKQGPMQEVVHHYFQTYQENRDDLPPKARELSYRDKMALAYPFHPDVIDILYEKWSTYPTFQRTRGVLRLLANVIEDLYQRETNIDLILPGDLNLEKPGIRQDFLKHIGSEYEGVIASDVAGHEAKAQALDRANRPWKHLAQRIASAIFFHSFSADDSEKGINLPYIKLAVLRPDTIPALVTEVLQKQANLLWYLNSRGDNYYFSKIPNLNRMILDKKELYNDSYEEELRRVVEAETGSKFRAYVWPETADNIPDNRDLKLLILRPEDRGEQIAAWMERKGQSFREYKNTLFFAVADTAAFTQLREEVKTYLALKEIDNEVKADAKSPLAARRSEIQSRMHNIQREYSYNVRRMYHTVMAGTRRIDLGQPVSGTESLGNWYWRELTSTDVGAIVEHLHYRVIANRLLPGNEQVAASLVLDQFYKNTDFPAPSSPEIVARAIQLGVQDGAFGLALSDNGPIDVALLRYQETVALGAIAFEPGVYLVNRERCEALREAQRQKEAAERQQEMAQEAGEQGEETAVTGTTTTTGGYTVTTSGDGGTKSQETPSDQKPFSYKQVRLVIGGIPASRIADVNRGIFMPLGAASDTPLTFTLTIEVSSEEGITSATLENKVKETIRQIGARIVVEETG
ncbi:MAG: ATP-binding protein [Pseudomonadales bacterium]|nr:ATP-binding protein [Saprospiraceae bacterium]MCP5191047.1 ATP-binding protein [Pseudomonadales bacterium]